MNLRNSVFWTLDRLSGNKIKNHYQDIKNIIENYSESKSKIDNRLESFLKYAKQNTDFYKNVDSIELSDFPVISKNDLREKYDEHLSKEFHKENLIELKTSGSYGTPFTFLVTQEKKNRQRAEVIYFGEWANYYVGTKHAYARANDNKNKMSLISQNEIFIKTSEINEGWLKEQRSKLLNSKVEVIIGFPSTIAEIASYCYSIGDKPNDFKVKGVITSGESLYDNLREKIEKTFDCVCISRYSSEELGVLAVECPEEQNHHLNVASYVVEILNEHNDEHVKSGELGRVVVTDLYSHAMPLIRYETGDLAHYTNKLCTSGVQSPILKSIEGRSLEAIIKPNGEKLSPFFVNPIMSYAKNISQFQFIQVGEKNYELKIVGNLNKENKQIIHNAFLKQLGEGANLEIVEVEKIPALRSGKRSYVVNEYIKQGKV